MDVEVLAVAFVPHIAISVVAYFGLSGLVLELTQLPRIALAIATPSVIGGALWMTSKATGALSEFLLAPFSAIGSL